MKKDENLNIGFLRLPDVLKLIPVGKSTWWAGVKAGRYPQPYKIAPRVTAWRACDIRNLSELISKKQSKPQNDSSE